MTGLRSKKQERERLARALRAHDHTWVQISGVFRTRYGVNPRVALRWSHGWSQTQAAAEWSRRWPDDPKTNKNFSSWELWPAATGHAPPLEVLGRLAELYQCSVGDLLADQADYRHLDGAHDGSGPPASHPGSLRDIAASPIGRRQALFDAIAVVAGASGLLPGRQPHASSRLGHSDITRLNAITALYRSLDSECGSGAIYRDVAVFAESVSGLLDRSRFTWSEDLGPSLLTAVAAVRQFAGWTALDAGRHTDAQRHLLFAERAAVAAGDIPLAANVRYAQARQFQHLGHDRDAVDTLRLAQEHLGSTATPAVSARLLGTEATSLAALADATALDVLERAREAFERIKPDREPDWIRFFDKAELVAEHGTVHRNLARHDNRRYSQHAIEWYAEAIASFGPQQGRSRVLNEVGLCSALFLANEPAEALSVGTGAISRASQLTSRRVVDRIRDLRRDIADRGRRSDVAAFLRTLATIGAKTA